MNDDRSSNEPPKEAIPTTWWKPRQIAETFQVTPRTVARWLSTGILPFYRFGRAVRVADDDLRAFIERNRSPRG